MSPAAPQKPARPTGSRPAGRGPRRQLCAQLHSLFEVSFGREGERPDLPDSCDCSASQRASGRPLHARPGRRDRRGVSTHRHPPGSGGPRDGGSRSRSEKQQKATQSSRAACARSRTRPGLWVPGLRPGGSCGSEVSDNQRHRPRTWEPGRGCWVRTALGGPHPPARLRPKGWVWGSRRLGGPGGRRAQPLGCRA